MTVSNTVPSGQHRVDATSHPERVPAGALLQQHGVPVPRPAIYADDAPTIIMAAIGAEDDDTARARRHLEQSAFAWLAPEHDASCGGSVTDGHRWYACPEPGVWGVDGFHPRRFCAVHAARRVRMHELLQRARRNAAAAKAGA